MRLGGLALTLALALVLVLPSEQVAKIGWHFVRIVWWMDGWVGG